MSKPVWVWLPGQHEPVHAADLDIRPGAGSWAYTDTYRNLRAQGAFPVDPIRLPIKSSGRPQVLTSPDGLPGVVRDAMPAGYGADRLRAQHDQDMSAEQLLELGPADGVGALEVCEDIDRKLGWRPHLLSDLAAIAEGLRGDRPASAAVRKLLDDASTSAGGERPKVTVQADGSWWLAKMQDRADIPQLPQKEFAVMSLIAELGEEQDIRIPRMSLQQFGEHHVFLVERFDRVLVDGDDRPQRRAFASAHTVLNLSTAAVDGDPARSYLAFADELRRWGKGGPHLQDDLAELWRRMVCNALVGNTDDHPRNHGLLHDGGHWRLAPAFDITPLAKSSPVLKLAVGADGSAAPTPERLLASATHFGVELEDAALWMQSKADWIADHFEKALRLHGVGEQEIIKTAQAAMLARQWSAQPALIADALGGVAKPKRLRRSTR